MNVSSLIVNARDGQAADVQALLTQQPGVEIHAASPEGKLIVTIETESDRETVAAFERITQTDGVLSAAMVYHQIESEPDQEI
ncbi:MAG: chaperone NapD [Burkholderiales bacterium]|nr:chaperone NapD [Burkholderiales bacterium]